MDSEQTYECLDCHLLTTHAMCFRCGGQVQKVPDPRKYYPFAYYGYMGWSCSGCHAWVMPNQSHSCPTWPGDGSYAEYLEEFAWRENPHG